MENHTPMTSYELVEHLASGGMADIFLARAISTAGVDRHVVLKRILPELAEDPNFVEMFLDEAWLAAQLHHQNIAQVHDIGQTDESLFFTMEYVHGETVRSLACKAGERGAPIPLGAVLAIAAGAAAGLHHAHERIGHDGAPLGIVHRDVSPSNLMVSYDGAVKVVDFGVAKAKHRSHRTQHGVLKGKASYMSPEQVRGDVLDRRSDLFSLGIVMWEMLTLERLFRRDRELDTMKAITLQAAPPPSQYRRDIPAELDALVLRLLEKEPSARFQTADELCDAIDAIAVGTGLSLSSHGLARYLRAVFGVPSAPPVEPTPSAKPVGYPTVELRLRPPSAAPAAGPPTMELSVADLSVVAEPPVAVVPRTRQQRAWTRTSMVDTLAGRGWLMMVGLAICSVVAAVLVITTTAGPAPHTGRASGARVILHATATGMNP